MSLTPEIFNKIKEAYVTKGFDSLAISALVGLTVAEVETVVQERNLEAARALFLAENPNISARLANQYQLASVLKKRQSGTDLSPAEMTFLTKLADQQRLDTEVDQVDYYNMSKDELDKAIHTLYRGLYHAARKTYRKRKQRF